MRNLPTRLGLGLAGVTFLSLVLAVSVAVIAEPAPKPVAGISNIMNAVNQTTIAMASRASSNAPWSRPQTETFAPSAAKASAMASPVPRLPPVTSTDLSLRSRSMVLTLS